MKEKDVWITGLQETRIGQDSREARKEYTWYFSGEKHKDKKKHKKHKHAISESSSQIEEIKYEVNQLEVSMPEVSMPDPEPIVHLTEHEKRYKQVML